MHLDTAWEEKKYTLATEYMLYQYILKKKAADVEKVLCFTPYDALIMKQDRIWTSLRDGVSRHDGLLSPSPHLQLVFLARSAAW
jgi:hypothetical protein